MDIASKTGRPQPPLLAPRLRERDAGEIRAYGKRIKDTIAASPHALAPLQLHYLRSVPFDIGQDKSAATESGTRTARSAWNGHERHRAVHRLERQEISL